MAGLSRGAGGRRTGWPASVAARPWPAVAGRRRAGPGRQASQPGQRRAQAGLGVEQEVGRDHHRLALAQAGEHLETVADAPAHAHLARLEAAVAVVDEHQLALAGRDQRALGHHQPAPLVGQQLDVGVHLGLERAVGVVDLQPHLDRAGLALDRGGDVADRAAPASAPAGRAPRPCPACPRAPATGRPRRRRPAPTRATGRRCRRACPGHHAHAVEDGLPST